MCTYQQAPVVRKVMSFPYADEKTVVGTLFISCNGTVTSPVECYEMVLAGRS